MNPGTLYIVATPIGNLEDITLRALRILKEADLIASEDTRTTRKLLSHFQIQKPLIAVFEYTSPKKLADLVEVLKEGRNIAYVSEAGTPVVSDPGARLVGLAREAGFTIVPVPGASAVTAAASAAGVSMDRFVFAGFLPRKSSRRRKAIEDFRDVAEPVILFESPHRIRKTLEDLVAILGPDRPILIARELTKVHEEIRVVTLKAAQDTMASSTPRGEYTLVIIPDESAD